MLELKYMTLKTSYEVDFFQISENIIELQGDFPIKTHGFTLSRPSHNDGWDYSDYTTVYRTIDNGVQFSNDGSVYVEPSPPSPDQFMLTEPYEPTQEELERMLEQIKINKINLSKLMLAKYLEDNPIHSTVHGGVDGVYSVTFEKQSLMMSRYITYQIEKAVNPNAKLTWNETEKSCEEWTEEEFLQLILEIKAYVYPLVSYQQKLEEKIANCSSQEELEKIVVDYTSITSEK